MTSVSKNVYTSKLNDTVNKYKKNYHSTTEMKPDDVNSTTYINFGINYDDKNLKFKIGKHLKISKNIKVILQKVTHQIGLKELL